MPMGDSILEKLRAIVGVENVLTAKEDLIPYAFDGTAAMKETPGCVVYAVSTDEISAALKLANFRVAHPVTLLAEAYRKENN
jgi:glycolate oxidase